MQKRPTVDDGARTGRNVQGMESSLLPRCGLAGWRKWYWSVAASCLVTSAVCLVTRGQDYSIDWHTIDGGGGTSTGSAFAVSGTIGQPDAGAMSGGTYALTGGFWALPLAVQSTNAPTLFIAPATPGFATISWDPATPGFVLQVSDTLEPPGWTNAPSGSTNPVIVPATFPARYHRLLKP